MDFLLLLIIGLGIIFTTYKMKIEKKGGLIFIFCIYLSLLLYAFGLEAWFYLIYDFTFSLPSGQVISNRDFSVLPLFFLEFFFIFYLLLYFFIFPFQDKKLSLKKKGYLLLRDFIILFTVFCFFFLYNDLVGKYRYYYDWYKNPVNFGGEEFICMDNSAKLILEQNYRHPVTVNPYNNFFEFYKNYGNRNTVGGILTNKLPIELVTESFLTTCKNSKGENYYQKYLEIHGKDPYFKYLEFKINYKYILNPQEIENIVTKLKNREYYIHNLIKYSYRELPLDITVEKFDEDFLVLKNLNDLIEKKRDLTYPEIKEWNSYRNFKPLADIAWYNIKGKGDIKYKGEDFGIPEWFYDKMLLIGGGWLTFYKDEDLTYTVTKTSLYKGTDLLFKNNYLYLGTNGPFDTLGKIGELFTFEFMYFDIENNQEFQDKECAVILNLGEESYGKCDIRYNEDESTEFICRDEKLLKNEKFITKYQEYKQCENLKYKSITTNISLAGELLNQKYNVLESKDIFEYNEKFGFIARSEEGYFIMYDGVQISENFDYIRSKTCCMIGKFPFKIYENGVLEYVFSREKNLYVGYVNLNIK